jgi:hypothetical protein
LTNIGALHSESLEAVEFSSSFLYPFNVGLATSVAEDRERVEQLIDRYWKEIVGWLWNCVSRCRSIDLEGATGSDPAFNFFQELELFFALLVSSQGREAQIARRLCRVPHSAELLIAGWIHSMGSIRDTTFILTKIISHALRTDALNAALTSEDPAAIGDGVHNVARHLVHHPCLENLNIFVIVLRMLGHDVMMFLLEECALISKLCRLLRRHLSALYKQPLLHATPMILKCFVDPLEFLRDVLMINSPVYGAQTGGDFIPFIWKLLELTASHEVPNDVLDLAVFLVNEFIGLTSHYSVLRHIYRDIRKYDNINLFSTDSECENRLWVAWRQLFDAANERMEDRREFLSTERDDLCSNPVRQ